MNVNVRTSSGTALHEAALYGKTEVVRTLLENGTDLNIRDAQNNTVMDILKQFPCHVVHDIYSLIKSKYINFFDLKACVYYNSNTNSIEVAHVTEYQAMYNERDDLFSGSVLNSPFDNLSYSLDSASPCSVSPMHFDSYERRTSLSGYVSYFTTVEKFDYLVIL